MQVWQPAKSEAGVVWEALLLYHQLLVFFGRVAGVAVDRVGEMLNGLLSRLVLLCFLLLCFL